MLVIQGVNYLQKWYQNTELPNGYLIGTSPSGYSNDTLSIKWLKHFEKASRARQKGVWRLLIFNGYGSHLTVKFIQFCDDNKIIPFSLPAYTSHLLQPLDVVVFQPLKQNYKKAVKMATRTGCTEFNKLEFLNAIHGIRIDTFKRKTVLSAWEKAGVFPYNPEIVYMKLPARSPRTPTPPPSEATSSPVTRSPTSYRN